MPSTVIVPNTLAQNVASDTINFNTDTFYGILIITQPLVTDATLADLTAKEMSGGTYVRKDLTKVGPSLANTNQSVLSYSTVTWTNLWNSSATTVLGMAVLKGTVAGAANTDKFVVYNPLLTDYVVPTTNSGIDFIFTFSSSGSLVLLPG